MSFYTMPQNGTFQSYDSNQSFFPSQTTEAFDSDYSHTTSENVEQPKSWKEGAGKIKEKTKGFFSNIGKTFKHIFSKKVFTPILGFIGRSVIDTVGQVFNHFSKILIPAVTSDNIGLYSATAESLITQLTNFAKQSLPKVEPLEPQVDAMLGGILNALQGGLHQFRQESTAYREENRTTEYENLKAELRRKEAELNALHQQQRRQAQAQMNQNAQSQSVYNGNPLQAV